MLGTLPQGDAVPHIIQQPNAKRPGHTKVEAHIAHNREQRASEHLWNLEEGQQWRRGASRLFPSSPHPAPRRPGRSLPHQPPRPAASANAFRSPQAGSSSSSRRRSRPRVSYWFLLMPAIKFTWLLITQNGDLLLCMNSIQVNKCSGDRWLLVDFWIRSLNWACCPRDQEPCCNI